MTTSFLNVVASVSQLTWACSRGKGLPFSNLFGYVSRQISLGRFVLYRARLSRLDKVNSYLKSR
ncbi:hypothetical protein BKA67DRAFT_195478 [Truncatella angustata]|uniref:Uncharacterized protein n=1 Tax=Truncatella angustata TaxID=152316 RepID=A0A9P8USV1_9PEZI|nr:uncharacterized protein BKA67DRAFT_195478 [Truncatella angustata]KAH6657686.1 hypothetical protein BKA67DRAFT_195478 [Truncatella angustata]